ncbi:hypothetical protein ANACOL_02721 [Anaerotruncus colihominis DSM 17241]|uniref:Uncharacterized protein n=1 Tax=Anaerotruncus colihominis DSM 17241 TaxID=445972 RepID=B0PDT6_9FIRM|nr:hypothetical protein ANACOL_02721 [Anaerotruncus colihominis DSM 17241]
MTKTIKYDIIKFKRNFHKKDTTNRMICQEFMRRFLMKEAV